MGASCVAKMLLFVSDGCQLHINCGGDKVNSTVDESIIFAADTDPGGPSNSVLAQDWLCSSTGRFMKNDNNIPYILSNVSEFSTNTTNPQLYMKARISPLSFTYYAFCLVNGNYRVMLHFAEIAFTDDETYNSLGRRMFDVFIQVNCSYHIILSCTVFLNQFPVLTLLLA